MKRIKKFLKERLTYRSKRKLQNVIDDFLALGVGHNLNKLGKIYKTDKSGIHQYTPQYQFHFKALKYKKVNLLEIGVGGYDNPEVGGASLRMWKKYFPLGRIYSIDIYDKSKLQEKRIQIFKGSQIDEDFLDNVCNQIGEIDIIIDDGSHLNEHVIKSFMYLFPKLKDGGIYVVEDTQTSYWPTYGGNSDDLSKPGTIMNYFKQLTDAMNNKEFIKPGYVQSYFDKKIISMHFYHNLIFVYKGDNMEESNLVVNNQKLKDH